MVLTSKPGVADWPYVLCLAHTGFKKKKEINASDKILRPQEFAPGCPACLKRLQAPASHLHSSLGSRFAATPWDQAPLLCHCPTLLAEFAPGTRVWPLLEADFPSDSCAVELNLGEVGYRHTPPLHSNMLLPLSFGMWDLGALLPPTGANPWASRTQPTQSKSLPVHPTSWMYQLAHAA